MDSAINRPNGTRHFMIIATLLAIIISVLIVLLTRSATLKVDREQVTISTVTQNSFYEYINLDGRIEPASTYLIDSKITGNVDRIFAVSGQEVSKGDTLMYVANADLELEVMQRESQLIEQLNAQRQTKLLLNQNDFNRREQLVEINYQLALQKKQYARDQKLFEQGIIAPSDFEPSENSYQYFQSRQKLLRASLRADSLARDRQLSQIGAFETRILKNLTQVRSILDRLYLLAATDGRLGDFSVRSGQAVTSGQRLGEIYSLEDPMVMAEVDEFYLDKIVVGQAGLITGRADSIRLEVVKIYPTVSNGRFRVDAKITGGQQTSEYFVKGQSVRFRLLFGEAESASILLANGGFFGSTGGRWVYRLNGDLAEKIPIRLGRSNPSYFEVLEGLNPGDRVITSGYDDFNDYKTISIN